MKGLRDLKGFVGIRHPRWRDLRGWLEGRTGFQNENCMVYSRAVMDKEMRLTSQGVMKVKCRYRV